MSQDTRLLEEFAPALAEAELPEADPGIVERLSSRRDLFKKAAMTVGGLASAPMLLAAASSSAFGQGGALPAQVVDTLNFALTLEYIESAFYDAVLTRHFLPRYAHRVVEQIGKHERAHVALLRGVLGSEAIARPELDLTGKGQYVDAYARYPSFLALAQTFEDLGVRAYKGQAPNLMGTPALTTALRIHSVEARHAAEIRLLRGAPLGEGAFDQPEAKPIVLLVASTFLSGIPAPASR